MKRRHVLSIDQNEGLCLEQEIRRQVLVAT